MSIAFRLGSLAGHSAAFAVQGTMLASEQFAAGASTGYANRAELLRAKREALALSLATTGTPPAPVRQRKLATAAAAK